MGVIDSHTFPEDCTPICSNCGVCLCWDISSDDYWEDKDFWDNWTCRDCNPNYKHALRKYKLEKLKVEIDTIPELQKLTVFFILKNKDGEEQFTEGHLLEDLISLTEEDILKEYSLKDYYISEHYYDFIPENNNFEIAQEIVTLFYLYGKNKKN